MFSGRVPGAKKLVAGIIALCLVGIQPLSVDAAERQQQAALQDNQVKPAGNDNDVQAEPELIALHVSNTVPSPDFLRVERLSQEIIKKELALYTLSSFFWREHLTDTQWFHWRRLMYRFLANWATLAGYIETMVVSYSYVNHSTPRDAGLAGTMSRMIAKSIVICGLSFELSLAAWDARRDRRQGYDTRTADRVMAKTKGEIDELMKQRAALIASARAFSGRERKLLHTETELLRDGCDQALQEYEDLHVRALQKAYMQSSFDVIRILRKLDGAYGGNLISIIAQTKKSRYLSQAGAYGTTVSASMGLLNPMITYPSTALVSRIAREHMKERLGNIDPDIETKFDLHREELHTLAAQTKSDAARAAQLCEQNGKIFDKVDSIVSEMDNITVHEKKSTKHRLIHREIIRMESAGAKLARGIMLLNLYYNPYYFAPQAVSTASIKTGSQTVKVTAGNHINQVVAQTTVPTESLSFNAKFSDTPAKNRGKILSGRAALVRVVGSGIQAADATYSVYKEIFHRKKLAEQRIMPSKILAARIESIDKLQEHVDKNLIWIEDTLRSQAPSGQNK